MGRTVAAIVGVVAVVAIAIAAPYLAPGVVAAFGSIGITVTTAVATALVTAALSIAASLAFTALGVGAPSAKNSVGPPQVFRQSITNSFIVYGRRRVGGLLVFFHAKQDGSGNHFRYFAIAVAGHHCAGNVEFMLNDEVVTVDPSTHIVTSGKYANACWLWFGPGVLGDQHTTFIAECDGMWTVNHNGNEVAALYAKFWLTDDVVQAGMPNITAVIDGRDNIVDPRTGTLVYTNNAALVFYDWMQMPREEGGFGAYEDEIPDTSWINAQANVCDETVHSEARYAIDGVITTGAAPSEVRDAMIVNMAGTYAYSGGKHLMRPGYWVPSSAALNEDDLAGPIQVSPFMPSDVAANQVQGTYISPDDGYQGMPFPTQTIVADDIRQTDLDLAFVTSSYRAQRIGQIMLRRAAAEKTVVWPMNIMGLKVAALDTVSLDSDRYGLSNYAWSVSNWSLSADWGVVASLREENEDIYADPTPVTPPTPPVITQPDPVLTQAQLIDLIGRSGVIDLNFTIDDTGHVNISDHDRIYADKSVGVVGLSNDNTLVCSRLGSVATGGVAGDIVYIFYDDPTRAGGLVTYQFLKLAGGTGDSSSAFASPTHPYRHFVCVGHIPGTGTTTGGGSNVGSGGGTPVVGGGAQGGEIP